MRSQFLRDPGKDAGPDRDPSEPGLHRQIRSLPEGEISDQRRAHARRLTRGLCVHLGIERPPIKIVREGALRDLIHAWGCTVDDAKGIEIFLESGGTLEGFLETLAHELTHAWQKATGGASGLVGEKEALQAGREAAQKYLRQHRKHGSPSRTIR